MTLSYTLRLHNRYQLIDDVTIDRPVWLFITEGLLDRYSNDQLKTMGSGQTSKLNMIHNAILDKYGDNITTIDGINQRVDDDRTDVKLHTVVDTMADTIQTYIKTLSF